MLGKGDRWTKSSGSSVYCSRMDARVTPRVNMLLSGSVLCGLEKVEFEGFHAYAGGREDTAIDTCVEVNHFGHCCAACCSGLPSCVATLRNRRNRGDHIPAATASCIAYDVYHKSVLFCGVVREVVERAKPRRN